MKETQLRQWLDHKISTPYTLVPDLHGISNDSYILTVEEKRYMVRTPKRSHDLLDVSFRQENEILDLVHDLDVPLVYFDTERGIKITRYIPHTHTYKETEKRAKAFDTGTILRSLHDKEPVGFYFDPFKKLDHYKKNARKPFISFDQEEQIVETVKKIYDPDTLCHNDLVDGNLLFSKDRLYLIDYEYASMNDARFDLASFLSENCIEEEEEREQFFEGYGITDDQTKKEVILFELFEDILWGYWANMLYETAHEELYKAIARDKEAHYRRAMKKISLSSCKACC